MTQQPTQSDMIDPLADLPMFHEPVGTTDEADRVIRKFCVVHGIAMASGFAVEDRATEALYSARRLAMFIIYGTAPRLKIRETGRMEGEDITGA